jgi:hypothetical protein
MQTCTRFKVNKVEVAGTLWYFAVYWNYYDENTSHFAAYRNSCRFGGGITDVG